MDRYICIHGHFYQPPRENPWLEAIELQDSAYPYHDWNERITAECYAPNGASRMLDGEGRIAAIVNNYARISFNIGPTLLAWLEAKAPDAYRAILDADRESRERFAGHGSAIAQVYNHPIMPLANRRDKETQVIWGLRDFQHRFGRAPEGMWLAETAVDLETLDILAEHGVRYTILAPYQAARVRPLDADDWQDVIGGQIDPTMAYRQRLPSGRTIDLFFYDGPISRAVAFERLLDRGEYLAERLLGAFDDGREHPQLVHIATDGESYGHHHRHGDMALAYALHYIEANESTRLTNYGEFLERYPPTHAVEIIEQTAWSCAHGIERWQSDCGCNSGGYPGWNQAWRGPLRAALDWLRDALAPLYEQQARAYVADPWAARDDYIDVILDRAPVNAERFLARHGFRDLSEGERITLWKLLEMQRHALLMYTSCGWFFDELSGIETVQVLQYAGRAVQLAREVGGDGIEAGFVDRLALAKSNLPEHRDGAHIYRTWVRPAAVSHEQVAAHYAISSLFETYPDQTAIYCYDIEREDEQRRQAGRARFVAGRLRVTTRITGESSRLEYGVLHFGDQTINCGVQPFQGEASHARLVEQTGDAFDRADLLEVIRRLDRHFGAVAYSLKSLFRDEQRLVVNQILDTTLTTEETLYRQIYEQHAPLVRFLNDLGTPLPGAFRAAAEFILNLDLRREVEAESPNPERVQELLEQAGQWRVQLDRAGLAYTLEEVVRRAARSFRDQPDALALLEQFEAVVRLARIFPFEVDIAPAQNDYWAVLQGVYPAMRRRAALGDVAANEWARRFNALGATVGVKVTEIDDVMREAPAAEQLADALLTRRRLPRATYRLQLTGRFTFEDAAALVPYLADLGISDAYASPIFTAAAGSEHGYDVADYSRLGPELGGEEGFAALAGALGQHGLGLLFDMVPNHMGIGEATNAWWLDVLENGPSSIHAPFFDIDWRPVTPELENKVLLPILEDQYGTVLEAGKLRLTYEDGAFFICYYEHRLPVNPRAYRPVLSHQLAALTEQLGADHEQVLELQSILTALNYLPVLTAVAPARVAERNREKEIIKRRLAALVDSSPAVAEAIRTAVRAFNGTVGDPASFDLLDQLLGAQAYRLAYWRVATDEINYRRFFDINQLAAIRVERPEVFAATHQVPFHLLAEGVVTGLRIDHPDGLWDPTAYFRQLQARFIRDRLAAEGYHPDLVERVIEAIVARPATDGRAIAWPLYVVAEKILSEHESLPPDWAVAGTTGYDFLNAVNGLFVDGSHEKLFDRIYHQFAGGGADFDGMVNSCKKMVMLIALASEVNALSHRLERIAEKSRRYRDLTLNSLTFALREVIACLGIYRTYITNPADAAASFNQAHIRAAVAEARRRNPRTAAAIFDFIHDTLLLRNLSDFADADQPELVDFVMRFQQITGPVMAKGLEDTAFYRYHRLVSLNEVGGHPAQFGLSPAAFHRQNTERQERWPHSMLASSTHDTKRSEDVRARLNVLSEMPEEWRAALGRWSRLNAAKKTTIGGAAAPDRNDEYLLYQTLLGAWPEPWLGQPAPMTADERERFHERIGGYMTKAVREAKTHTSWVNPNTEYETALAAFVRSVINDGRFLNDLRGVHRRVAFFGQINALAQTLLKLTAPGVPDFYQGTELWDFSLVDPDNRRPVDYERRRAALSEVRAREASAGTDRRRLCRDLLETATDGRIKLYIIARTLACRRDHACLFRDGGYMPLEVSGEKRAHVCAFARPLDGPGAIVVVPRLVVGLTGGEPRLPLGEATWGDTRVTLPREWAGRRFANALTGERVDLPTDDDAVGLALGALCAHLPLALLLPTDRAADAREATAQG